MYRLLLVACGALADHAGFTTRGRRLCGGGGGGGGGSLATRRRSTRSQRAGRAVSPAPLRRTAARARRLLFARWRPRAARRRAVFRPGSSFAKSQARRPFLARGQPPRPCLVTRDAFSDAPEIPRGSYCPEYMCFCCRGRRLELVSLSLGSSPPVKPSLDAHCTSSWEVSTNPAR